MVITIIGMLIALLLPAVNAARERGRQTHCMTTSIRYCSGADLLREQAHGAFPGWRNNVTYQHQFWRYSCRALDGMILPDVERNDLWTMYQIGHSCIQRTQR